MKPKLTKDGIEACYLCGLEIKYEHLCSKMGGEIGPASDRKSQVLALMHTECAKKALKNAFDMKPPDAAR